ncbi:hypothetical protein GCM10010272_35630 [Streptomyces lateritius]|nr:hypothetical protein GCM10010272_35630 [Streptomyces lateritius]
MGRLRRGGDGARQFGVERAEGGHLDGLGHRLGIRRPGSTGHRDGAEDATGNSGTERELRSAAAGLPVAGYVSGVGHEYNRYQGFPVPIKKRVLRHSYDRNHPIRFPDTFIDAVTGNSGTAYQALDHGFSAKGPN